MGRKRWRSPRGCRPARRRPASSPPELGSFNSQTALELARRTLPIVEPEAEPALISRVLTTIGMARVHLGDRNGVADLEQAVALAETARSPDDLHTALNNLANMHWRLGELDEAKVRHEQARQADEYYGYENGLRWLVAERLFDHMLRGEWNEALPLAEAVLAEHDPVTSYLHMPTYLMRALVEAGRSQRDAALADSEQALTSARRSQDAQQLGPAILGRAQVLVTIGRSHEANELVDELMVDADLADPWLHELPLLLCELGRGAEYAATLARDQRRSRWLEAGLAAASGRHAEAVEIYGAIGARVAQARARLLRAGVLQAEGRSREAQAELDAAANWFRAIGATYYAGRCDAILQASA
jgi:tetratricopeptide (TPR) repeat protein